MLIVKISAAPQSGNAPLTVNFTSTATDPDGSIASYSWDFGDGGASAEQNPTHTYNNTGAYTAKLTVTDNGGAKASDTVQITVSQVLTPNLTLTKSALVNGQPASEAAPGNIITYTIVYQNIGAGEATNVIITDPIPAGTIYETDSARFVSGSGIINDKGPVISWTITTLPTGQGGEAEFRVIVE